MQEGTKRRSRKKKNEKCTEWNVELKTIYIESILILNIMGDTVKEQRKQTNELEEDKQKINDNKKRATVSYAVLNKNNNWTLCSAQFTFPL